MAVIAIFSLVVFITSLLFYVIFRSLNLSVEVNITKKLLPALTFSSILLWSYNLINTMLGYYDYSIFTGCLPFVNLFSLGFLSFLVYSSLLISTVYVARYFNNAFITILLFAAFGSFINPFNQALSVYIVMSFITFLAAYISYHMGFIIQAFF